MKPLGVFLAALSSSVLQAKQCTISNADIVHVTSLYGSPGADGGEGGLSGFDGSFDPETSENKCELRYRRLLRRRSSGILQCTGNEDCVRLDGEDEAFCYNAATKDFHLGDGTIGNLKNGDYTSSSGEKGNLWKYSVSTPTPSAGPITGGFATFTPSATTTVRTPSAGPVTETFATFTPSATTTSSTRSSGSSSTATGESATTTAGTQTSTGAPVATSSAPPSGGERVVALRWNEMVLGSGGVVFALLWL
ncbi:hypothetical protein B0O99DRAFT_639936 [Bisporella sp. PMI_857]|nr:hypothetical protein B0O99DRAFT_639936 [Bisporella sp. PMI_857]